MMNKYGDEIVAKSEQLARAKKIMYLLGFIFLASIFITPVLVMLTSERVEKPVEYIEYSENVSSYTNVSMEIDYLLPIVEEYEAVAGVVKASGTEEYYCIFKTVDGEFGVLKTDDISIEDSGVTGVGVLAPLVEYAMDPMYGSAPSAVPIYGYVMETTYSADRELGSIDEIESFYNGCYVSNISYEPKIESGLGKTSTPAIVGVLLMIVHVGTLIGWIVSLVIVKRKEREFKNFLNRIQQESEKIEI